MQQKLSKYLNRLIILKSALSNKLTKLLTKNYSFESSRKIILKKFNLFMAKTLK